MNRVAVRTIVRGGVAAGLIAMTGAPVVGQVDRANQVFYRRLVQQGDALVPVEYWFGFGLTGLGGFADWTLTTPAGQTMELVEGQGPSSTWGVTSERFATEAAFNAAFPDGRYALRSGSSGALYEQDYNGLPFPDEMRVTNWRLFEAFDPTNPDPLAIVDSPGGPQVRFAFDQITGAVITELETGAEYRLDWDFRFPYGTVAPLSFFHPDRTYTLRTGWRFGYASFVTEAIGPGFPAGVGVMGWREDDTEFTFRTVPGPGALSLLGPGVALAVRRRRSRHVMACQHPTRTV